MKVTCENFPDDYPLVKGDKELKVSLPSLVHAAITVGAPSLFDVKEDLSSWRGICFALHKIFAIESVMQIEENTIQLQRGYECLDQSEKVALSYWTGMFITKLVAEQLLDVPWPAHVRAMQKKKILTTDPKKSRSLPDLVGHEENNDHKWHVLEAKCRKEDPSLNEKISWKKQAQRIVEINGHGPSTTSYCLTIQKPKHESSFKIEFVDPEPTMDTDPCKIIVDPIKLQQFYYQPFYDIFKDEKPVPENEVIYSPKKICDMLNRKQWSIGILESVFNQVDDLLNASNHKKNLVESHKYAKEYKKKQGDSSKSIREYCGYDGIVVQMI